MAPERDAADASDLEAFVERPRSPEEIERLRLEALPPDEYEVEIQILENSKKDLRTPEKRANDRRRADRERQRAWREANPEKVAQQHREWAAKNPERQRKHGRDYYYRNRETFKERDDRRAATTAGRAKRRLVSGAVRPSKRNLALCMPLSPRPSDCLTKAVLVRRCFAPCIGQVTGRAAYISNAHRYSVSRYTVERCESARRASTDGCPSVVPNA